MKLAWKIKIIVCVVLLFTRLLGMTFVTGIITWVPTITIFVGCITAIPALIEFSKAYSIIDKKNGTRYFYSFLTSALLLCVGIIIR